MAGSAVADGVVVIGRDGKVERVGPAASTPSPKGYRVLRARVATPGLIDAHTVVGLAGALNQPHDQMQLDRSAPLLPELRALDAYNPREVLVEWVRNHGTTTLHTGHAPGALLSGQTMIVKTRPGPVEDVVIEPAAMLAMTLGPEVSQNFGNRGGTRARNVAMLRAKLIEAQNYARRRSSDTAQAVPATSTSTSSPPCSIDECPRSSPPSAPPRSSRRSGSPAGVRVPHRSSTALPNRTW
jgi:imidazolonepropionase-like amidohydrolase